MKRSFVIFLLLASGMVTLTVVLTGLSAIRTIAYAQPGNNRLNSYGERPEMPQANKSPESGLVAARLVPEAKQIRSDDFDTCTLSPFWLHVPGRAGDPTPALSDTDVSLSVPGGLDHDTFWEGSFANRIMQSAANTNFEVEAKFTSGVGEKWQTQGILVEQDGNDLLRFEFYGKNSETYIYAAKIVDGQPSHIAGNPGTVIASGYTTPLYMRVKRQGDQWTQSYSFDGNDWTDYHTFSHPFTVTAIGVYGGNASEDGKSAPAHTAIVDYFYNTDDPGSGADQQKLTVGIIGKGSVTKKPDLSDYACGQRVTLKTTADKNWAFIGWSGDLSGFVNPAIVKVTGDNVVTATFATVTSHTLTIDTDGSGIVQIEPDKPAYSTGDIVTLTAQADKGWVFTGWSGDLSGTENPAAILMKEDVVISATFKPAIFLPLIITE